MNGASSTFVVTVGGAPRACHSSFRGAEEHVERVYAASLTEITEGIWTGHSLDYGQVTVHYMPRLTQRDGRAWVGAAIVLRAGRDANRATP